MIENIHLRNYGVIDELHWNQLGKINVIVGENGSGKTFLLKSLYCALKTIEGYKRGNEMRRSNEILRDKLNWTFQVDKIGDIVKKGSEQSLEFNMDFNGQEFGYSFGSKTSRSITTSRNNVDTRDQNSIFLPAKEVLTLFDVIIESRENDKLFGFDDTYYDLVKALQKQRSRGKNYPEFSQSRKLLDKIVDGKIEYNEVDGKWYFKRGNQKFSIHSTAEGIKKISILDQLLGNRYLSRGSIIFIDEPESAIHPKAIAEFMEIIKLLSDNDVQIFIATHSYFVIKKLRIIATKNEMSIPFISLNKDKEFDESDLKIEMPDNAIITESIRLYEEELESDMNI